MRLEQSSKYRCQHGIVEEILTLLADEPRNQTRVMYGAILSFKQLQTYRERLERAGLVKVGSDGKWQITEKGRNFLQNYQDFKEACA
jgi:predicted transcriptional regulator